MAIEQEPSQYPSTIVSIRAIGDVAEGTEPTPVLIEAARTGDIAALEEYLSSEDGIKNALRKVRAIDFSALYARHSTEDPSQGPRPVAVIVQENALRAIAAASFSDQPAAYTYLDKFVVQHKLIPNDAHAERVLVVRAIRHGQVDMFKAIVAAHPRALVVEMSHLGRPLDYAVYQHRGDMVEAILVLGAHLDLARLSRSTGYVGNGSLMTRAMWSDDTRIWKLLLKHKRHFGALHSAAMLGDLAMIRAVMSEGSNVDERIANRKEVKATWTPLHYAASKGHADAMDLLQSYGAQPDVRDESGKTPADLLEDFKQATTIP